MVRGVLLVPILCTLCLFTQPVFTQEEEQQKTFDKRILFILDGSGSMKESWQGESKWEMAVQTLSNLIDSFQSVNKDFEIGIRVLGYQFPRAEHRCDDSKFIIPFSKALTFHRVNSTLSRLHPQGHTPLAYSIGESEKDFPEDISALHSIILITDGLENCGGNPCEVAQKLKAKNIFITPYIIGLGIDSLETDKLECIGKFIDAKNKDVFKKLIRNILNEVSQKTTLSVFFTDMHDQPVPHYVPYSLIDKRSHRDITNFIYTPNSKKNLDTININIQYQYALLVHSNPPFIIDTFSLIQGRHNIWTAKYEFGMIELEPKEKRSQRDYIIRIANEPVSRVYGQLSYAHLAVANGYLDLIEHPDNTKKISITGASPYIINTSPLGTFKIRINDKLKACLFSSSWNLVMPLHSTMLNTYDLVSGDYYLLFKKETDPAEKTKFQSLRIVESQTLPLAIP